MSTLYRDYRPQKFSEVLGQNHVKIALQHEIEASKTASAYLFCGPRAVGKTTVARILAKAVNCEQRPQKQYEPCNTCPACQSITAGKNLDVVEIDAASNTGVDNVRENIIAFSRLAPLNAKFKVFIIDEVHMLSLSAFNALLKIIEEPPLNTMFILCTTEVQKVPGTVISRCERYDFQHISVKDIVKKLSYIAQNEKVKVDSEVLEAVARHSGGYLRDAESLLGKIFSLSDQEITREQAELVIPHYNSNEAVDLLDHLIHKDAVKAISLINSLVDSGINVKVFTGEIIELLRKIMLGKLSPELVDNLGLDLGENLEKRLSQLTVNLDWQQLFSFTRRFLKVFNDYKNLSIPQLPLELAVTELSLGLVEDVNFQGINSDSKFKSPSASPRTINSATKAKTNFSSNDSQLTTSSSPPEPSKPSSSISSSLATKENFNLTKSKIIEKWPEFLIKIKKYNHSLSFVLQNCDPREIKNSNLFLVFKYKFHQNRINDAAIRNIVEKTLAEVFKANLSFSSEVDEKLQIKHSQNFTAQADSSEHNLTPNSKINNSSADSTLQQQKPNSVAPPSQSSSGLLGDLLNTFGGEVIS